MIDLSKIQEAKKLLKQYFGYDEFRQGQEQLIEAALNGQDVLGIMPTEQESLFVFRFRR